MQHRRFSELIVAGMFIGLTGWTVLSANGENILRDASFEDRPAGGLKVWNKSCERSTEGILARRKSSPQRTMRARANGSSDRFCMSGWSD